jgi:hypothetical protein
LPPGRLDSYNLFKDDLKKHIDEIWAMLQRAYASLEGGFATASSKQDLINKTFLTKCVTRNGKIVAVRLYKDAHGRKSIAAATDGSVEGKMGLYKMIDEDILRHRSWGEVSDKMEYIMTKRGGFPIPNIYVKKLLKKDIISLDPDGYHYTREIAGQPHTKIIFAYDGFVNDMLT